LEVDWSFDIQNLVTLRIRERQGLFEKFLARPERGYGHYRSERKSDGPPPDLDVIIGPFDFDDRPSVLIERRFRIGEDYFACKDTSKILWWKLEVDGFDGSRPSVVKIDRNLFGTAALGSRIIDCLLRYRLNLKGAPAIHGCAVVSGGGAVIFAGSSGVGKSTIAMRMLERGLPLLGDNWIPIRAGTALGFHLPLNLHHYNVPANICRALPPRYRFDIQFKKYCWSLSGGYLKKSCPIVLKRFFPTLAAESAPIRRIISLVQGQAYGESEISHELLTHRLAVTNMMDREAFYRYMQAYSTVYPNGPVATHWERLRRNMAEAIPAGTELIQVTVPKRLTEDVISRVAELVD